MRLLYCRRLTGPTGSPADGAPPHQRVSWLTIFPFLCVQLRLAKGHQPGRVVNLEKAREYLWRLADVYDRMACFPHAEAQLRELLDLDLSKEQRLEALCFLADIQVCPRSMSASAYCSLVRKDSFIPL